MRWSMKRATRSTAQRRTYDIGERRPARFLGSLSEEVRGELLSIGSPQQYPPERRSLWKGHRVIAW